MRAIDADALLDEVMERHCKECDKRKGIKNGKYRIIYEIGDAPCRACDVDDVKDELENAPTIEPRCEVCEAFNKTRLLIPRTGRWKGYNADNPKWQRNDGSPIFLSCSECHGTVMNNGSAHWNYCPNCGTRMEDSE